MPSDSRGGASATSLGRGALGSRQQAYRCLAALLCEPDVWRWRDADLGAQLTESVLGGAPAVAPSARAVADAIRDADDLAARRAYAALFVGPGPLLAPPYGSVHLDHGRRLLGPSTDRVVAAFREAGLELDSATHEAPDHVAVELEFLQALDWRTLHAGDAEEAAGCARLRRRFLVDLVVPWIPGLAAAVRSAAPAPPYAAIADCLESVVLHDARDAWGTGVV